jgi:hypothetical protein
MTPLEKLKVKRKRDETSVTLDFVTALTVEQCVERLEKGPTHTLDYRLTVRTDGRRFVVEAWGEMSGRSWLVANFEGRLNPTTHGPTRVSGFATTKNPWDSLWPPLLMLTVAVVLCVVEWSNSPVSILWLGAAAVFYWFYSHSGTRVAEQTPDLRRWVRKQLDMPPEQPTP